MNFSVSRIVRAIAVGVLGTALIALWRSITGSVVESFADQALRAMGCALGWYLVDLLRARFWPHPRVARRRSIMVWTLAMAGFVALLFASVGLLNGADWTTSQWAMALVTGGLVGSVFGALSAWFWNAAYVRAGSAA